MPGDEEKKEYYLSLMQEIIDKEKEFLGEEPALRWARKAPLEIDEDGNVVDFYGEGESALEILRRYTEHQEFYLDAIREVVGKFADFQGEKSALSVARRGPLMINKENEIESYYGRGRKALQILVEIFSNFYGTEVARQKAYRALEESISEEEWKLVPEPLQEFREGSDSSPLGRLVETIERVLERLRT